MLCIMFHDKSSCGWSAFGLFQILLCMNRLFYNLGFWPILQKVSLCLLVLCSMPSFLVVGRVRRSAVIGFVLKKGGWDIRADVSRIRQS